MTNIYQNKLLQGEGVVYELADLAQKSEDGDRENKILVYDILGQVKTSAKFHDFEIRHCRRVKSIRFNGEVFNSIYKPGEDHRYFIINRNKTDGKFCFPSLDMNVIKKLNFARDTLCEEMKLFVDKVNEITQVEHLNRMLRFIKVKKMIILTTLLFVIVCLAYFVFFILFGLFLWLFNISLKDNDEGLITIGWSTMNVLISFICIIAIFFIYKKVKGYRSEEKFICFSYFHLKKEDILKEIEYWNTSVLQDINMKIVLAETYDYIQVFYENRWRVQLYNHFNC